MALAEAFTARLAAQSGHLALRLAGTAEIATQVSAAVRTAFGNVRTAAGAAQGLATGYGAMLQSLERSSAEAAVAVVDTSAHVRSAASGVSEAFRRSADGGKGFFGELQSHGMKAAESIRAAFTRVGFAFAAIGAASFGLFKALEQGEKVKGVTTSFEKLTAAIGGANATLERLQRAAGGGVDNMTLMLATNKLMIADLGLTRERIASLVSGALALSRVMGTDAKTAVTDLAEGVQKQSPLILDNLGITVRMEGALKKYAEANGIATSAIDEHTRKLVFLETFEETATEAKRKLGAGIDAVATPTARLATLWSNLTDKFVVMLANEPGIFEGLQAIAGAAAGLMSALTPLVKVVAEFVALLAKIPGLVPALAGAAAGFAVGGPIGAGIGFVGGGLAGIAGAGTATAPPAGTPIAAAAPPAGGGLAVSINVPLHDETIDRTAARIGTAVARGMRRRIDDVQGALERGVERGLEAQFANVFLG
jgi:hypothetical protein